MKPGKASAQLNNSDSDDYESDESDLSEVHAPEEPSSQDISDDTPEITSNEPSNSSLQPSATDSSIVDERTLTRPRRTRRAPPWLQDYEH